MKVKCLSTKRPNEDNYFRSLTVDKEYIILAIEIYDKSESTFSNYLGDFVGYRLKDDDGIISLYPSKLFKLTSNEIPSDWVFFSKKDGSYSILPKLWARDFFWDDYYNDDYDAIKDFKEVEKKYI